MRDPQSTGGSGVPLAFRASPTPVAKVEFVIGLDVFGLDVDVIVFEDVVGDLNLAERAWPSVHGQVAVAVFVHDNGFTHGALGRAPDELDSIAMNPAIADA